MRVAIRTDAGYDIGTGHLMRCLALARRLQVRGAKVLFICKALDLQLRERIEAQACALQLIGHCPDKAEDAEATAAVLLAEGRHDLVVVDHYGLDASWEKRLRPHTRRIMVIDDLADRPHDCDLLLDQNLHDSPQDRYRDLVPVDARVFVGPRYALLREEFDSAVPRVRDEGLRRLLVFFGGTDPGNQTLKLVHALRTMDDAPHARVVLGPANPHLEAARNAASGFRGIEVIAATSNMAGLIEEADLGIGTCGGAAWERCLLGLPTLVVITADNQRDDARILDHLGAVRNLGDADAIGVDDWIFEIRHMQLDTSLLERMSVAALNVMKGHVEALAELEEALVV